MLSLLCWNHVCKNLKFNKITLINIYFNKYSTTNSINSDSKTPSDENKLPLMLPEEPTTCCMSGCANCVWLDYAEELSKFYKDGGEQAIKDINERISDPNIKAYILQEIRIRNKM